MPPTSLDVIIVNFRGGAVLHRCIKALGKFSPPSRIIVVDNEGIGESLRRTYDRAGVRVLEMPKNVGYGTAANRGLEESDAQAILVLNQDIVISQSAVETMMEAGRGSGAWIVGPRLIDSCGREAEPKVRFPSPLKWERPSERGPGYRFVPWVSGAAMLLMPGHTDLRFDERLFMYVEDEELCWRVWDSGGSVVLATDARITHEGASASAGRWSRRKITYRVVGNRSRMVLWHRGWRGLIAYLFDLVIGKSTRS